jgi:aspartyl/asparaginyl beta-hydroxylase (cupin superfamily)
MNERIKYKGAGEHLQEDSSNIKKKEAYNPPKNYAPKYISAVINWAVGLIERFSVYGNPPVYDNSLFPWVREIEKEWMKIRAELENVMQRREELPNFQEITSQVKPITNDNLWKTYLLAGYGLKSEMNAKSCPETARILKKIPGMKTAFFSILAPNKHIPSHKGPYNGVLRYHLGLIVPEPQEQCRIRICDEIKHWEEGKSLIFDDTFNHEVWNDTPGFRAVLFVDFVRPLKFPVSILNKFILKAAIFTPVIREAAENYKRWEKKFYKQ